MNIRALLYLAITSSLLTLMFLGISTTATSSSVSNTLYLDYNHVRGSAIEHGLNYTLNFEQQNALITYLNEADAFSLQISEAPPPFTKLYIYRFNAPDIVITPLAYLDNNLLFSSPEWNNGAPLLEKSQGKLKFLLENAYD